MSSYLVIDNDGRRRATIPGVLDRVALTGVSTTSASNILTVASTTGVYHGMAIAAPNIPQGAFVHAVKSSTEIELWATAWDATNGKYTTSAANANATANGSSLLAAALGFDPLTFVTQIYAMGTWRNIVRSPGLISLGSFVNAVNLPSAPLLTYSNTALSSVSAKNSDELDTTPLKRHNGEPWGTYLIVSTGGLLTKVPAQPDWIIQYNGADA